jgi:hypothetical protein
LNAEQELMDALTEISTDPLLSPEEKEAKMSDLIAYYTE